MIVYEHKSKDETLEDIFVLHYDSSPENIKEKITYYAKQIKLQREKLGLNPSGITVESASLNNFSVNSTRIFTSLCSIKK